jgi:hypothetical protein
MKSVKEDDGLSARARSNVSTAVWQSCSTNPMTNAASDSAIASSRHRVIASVMESCSGMPNGPNAVVLRESRPHEQNFLTPSEQAVGSCVIGFQRESLFEQWYGLGRLFWHRDIDPWGRSQNKVVGVEVLRPLAFNAFDLRIAQTGLYGAHDALFSQYLISLPLIIHPRAPPCT